MGGSEGASATTAVAHAKQPAGGSLSNGDARLPKFGAGGYENPIPECDVNRNAWLCTGQPFVWWGCSDLLVRGGSSRWDGGARVARE